MIGKFFASALILLLAAGSQAQANKPKPRRWNWKNHETEIIEYAKKYPVSNLDSRLPPESFEKWFQTTVGETAQVDWEIDDCGEQSGTRADRGRDFPMCVSATAQKAEFFYISVDIQFGMFSRGVSKEKPVVRSITTGDIMEGEWIDNLSDLPKKIGADRKPSKYLDPNDGVFVVSGELPPGFEKISGIQLKTMDYTEKGKYVSITPTGEIQIGQMFFKIQNVIFNGESWHFETIKMGNVSYKFDGKFAQLRYDADGAVLGDRVLQGHLTKLFKDRRTAEADLVFDFVTTRPCKGCGQSPQKVNISGDIFCAITTHASSDFFF